MAFVMFARDPKHSAYRSPPFIGDDSRRRKKLALWLFCDSVIQSESQLFFKANLGLGDFFNFFEILIIFLNFDKFGRFF